GGLHALQVSLGLGRINAVNRVHDRRSFLCSPASPVLRRARILRSTAAPHPSGSPPRGARDGAATSATGPAPAASAPRARGRRTAALRARARHGTPPGACTAEARAAPL